MSNGFSYPPISPRTDDPAWQEPRDPLKDARPGIIVREIPSIASTTRWSWLAMRTALYNLEIGVFDLPAQLVETILWDARVQAAMGSRTGGLLGRAVKFEAASNPRVAGSDAARECLDAWMAVWPTVSRESALANLHTWGTFLFGLSQLLWDKSVAPHVPYLVPFHPRYTYYHHNLRKIIAMTLDGQLPVDEGNGHWVVHAPYGYHRGWMRGVLPALAQPWIQRNFAYRDVARFCERHGYPIYKLKVPAVADPKQIAPLKEAIKNLGQESVFELPQGIEPSQGYDVEMLEAQSATWEVFGASIDLCNADIALALLGQNLTTEVKEGSFAAARMHGDVRQAFIEFDNRALSQTIYTQIARPFALINFGDADLAPWTSRDVEPYEDYATAAQTFSSFANSILALRNGGIEIENVDELARMYGVRNVKFKTTQPTQVEAAHASSGAPAAASGIKIELTPSDIATIVTVDEARVSQGLPPMGGEDGKLTLSQFKAKYSEQIATVADAESGDAGESEATDADD